MIKSSKKPKKEVKKKAKTRENGEGSIFKRSSDGKWVGSVYLPPDENGVKKRKIIYGKSKSEVASKLTAFTGKISSNQHEFANKTFGELMFEWLMVFKKSAVTPRTFEGNIRSFQLHIQPFIGKMKLKDVNVFVLQQLINGMVEKDYSVDTIKKNKHLINQFFEYAISNNWVLQNPTLRIKLRSRDKVSSRGNMYKALPPDVRMKFISELNKEPKCFIRPLCITLMFAGLRIAEAIALQWSDVDFVNHKLKVKQAITQIPKFDSNGNIKERVTVIGSTKTACSVREIPIVDIVVKVLTAWRDNQIERQQNDPEVTGDITSQNAYIFSNNDGTIRSYSGTRKIFSGFY